MQEESSHALSDSEIQEMFNALHDQSARVRAGNALSLGEHGAQMAPFFYERTVELLLAALDDEDVMVVGAAATSLGRIAGGQAIPKLISTLERLTDSTGLFQAARYGYGVSSGTIMYEASSREPSVQPSTTAELTRLVHEAHPHEPMDVVEQRIAGAFHSMDVEIQKLGLWVHKEIMSALATFVDESAVKAIAKLLESSTPHLREDAAGVLSEFIQQLADTESTLDWLSMIEDRLLSASKEGRDVSPSERNAWHEAQSAVAATLHILRQKRRAICKALGRPTGNIWNTIRSWFSA